MLNGLDLFSGIGGIPLALAPWVKPYAYCEIDPYCQAVLLSRMADKSIPVAPIWDDVRNLSSDFFGKGSIDIITAGFPCQDISTAGLGRGLEGNRSGLVREVYRLWNDLEPKFVFLENVPAITTRGGLEIVAEITRMGYDCRWCIIPSGHCQKGFEGKRWFLLAKAKSQRHQTLLKSGRKKEITGYADQAGNDWLDAPEAKVEPSICGTFDGIPYRLDRVKSLGNAVVPKNQVREAFKYLIGEHK